MFKYAFPVPEEELDQLVYLHDFVLDSGEEFVNTNQMEDAVMQWRKEYNSGTTLRLSVHASGTSTIEDSRPIRSQGHYELNAEETLLYLFLDAGVSERKLEQKFRDSHPHAMPTLEHLGGINTIIGQWLADSLVLVIDNRVVSLALYVDRKECEEFQHIPERIKLVTEYTAEHQY